MRERVRRRSSVNGRLGIVAAHPTAFRVCVALCVALVMPLCAASGFSRSAYAVEGDVAMLEEAPASGVEVVVEVPLPEEALAYGTYVLEETPEGYAVVPEATELAASASVAPITSESAAVSGVPGEVFIWDDFGRVFFADAFQRPLSGTWRIDGVDYVLADDGTVVAGGGQKGTKGRLYIPVASIDVAVNISNDDDAQLHTDLHDSSAYMRYSLSKYYIADHSDQAFVGLTQVQEGDIAYLFTSAGIEAFTCTRMMYGHNIEWGLTNDAGDDIAGDIPLDGFIAYTCLDSWRNVHITFWERTWIASAPADQPLAPLEQRDARNMPMEPASSPMELAARIQEPLLTGVVSREPSLLNMLLPAEKRTVFFGLEQWGARQGRAQLSVADLGPLELRPDLKMFRQLLQARAA